MSQTVLDRIGFGCVGLTIQASCKKALNLLECAYDQGITLYDTAPVYGSGYSEIILGQFIQNKREKVKVTTKFGLGPIQNTGIPVTLAVPLNHLRRKYLSKHKSHASIQAVAPKALEYRKIDLATVQQHLLDSLKRLNTEYIDNYLIHEGVPSFVTAEARDFLVIQQQKGVIRKLGMGTAFRNIENLSELDLQGWDILQYEHGIKNSFAEPHGKFGKKQHICHSLFKEIPISDYPSLEASEIGGYLLAQALKDKPGTSFIFSSSRYLNIKNNVKYAIGFYNSNSL